MRIAVVGSGIAGLACAHILGPHHDVVLYEATDRLGGHSNTVVVDDPQLGPTGIDTGFIVHNDRNYPNLVRLFAELGIETVDSEMSFAVRDPDADFYYRATNLNTLFAQRRRLVDPAMWMMLADIVRFHRSGRRMLGEVDNGETRWNGLTIGDLLDRGRYRRDFVDRHLVPMGAAVWSTPPSRFRDFPAISLLRFLDNHGLLSIGDRPQWRTVAGGSRRYVSAIEQRFDGSVRLGCPVLAVTPSNGGVSVVDASGCEWFDQVILACHSDQSLRLVADGAPELAGLLTAIPYQPNRATLHTDVGILAPRSRSWAAWNYRIEPDAAASTVTYDLTLLMRLATDVRYLVTLNDTDQINTDQIIQEIDYSHPVFDHAATEAQARIRARNGSDGIWLCGAWMGYGFHEDGMRSAVDVCRRLGVRWGSP
ncbi:MAG: FAD-dependent oxidoreductase [Acidimicrobiia bacterium]|nr:FAD-dependent oxidoreductase [Acidimicrobiia bacterium]